ncbi:MAG: hypothetical protein Kow00121_08750 [Elainellaceae cyanobacterium]
MTLAPWRQPLAHALHRNRSLAYSRYLQLATVRPDGRPANRTVVFRGFLENTDQLKFITDDRSEKVEQIPLQPWGEVCWYFPKTREQFRLLGQLTLVGKDHSDSQLLHARQAQWRDLSDNARLQFTWAHSGKPRADAAAFDSPPPDPQQPLPNFCLLLLTPTLVDHLELRGEPQNRYRYQRDKIPDQDETWSVQEVNP